MNSQCRTHSWPLSLVIAVYLVLLVGASAQVKTTTSTKEGPGVKEVTVERGEVVYVSGNDLIVKMEDGQMRHFPNIPESARVTVDGKELGIDELTPGMKLERTLTVTTIPRTITTVETVTGKVWQVTPPTSVTLTLKNGEHQAFKIPKGQKFNVDGQETDAWGLKKGTNITATRIREVPETVVQHERQVSGQMPPPPPPLPANTPILIAQATPPRAAPAPTAAAPAALPATGSFVPLIGLLGLLLAGSSVFMRFMRRRC